MIRLPKALIQIILLVGIPPAISPEAPEAPIAVPSAEQIVARMQEHEAQQTRELKHYDATRHYQVRYKGFKANIAATMDVAVSYEEDSGKSLRILSQSGSKLLCDKVLKRAVESEEEASRDKQSTALTPANYRFQVTGSELLNGRPVYILHVEPLRAGKFLYRGSIWVDAQLYGVDKIEAEPAKNPSFWITSTHIENTNQDIRGVWLPQKNRSESKIRIGGTAVLTIDYGTYRVVLNNQAGALERNGSSSGLPAPAPAGL